MDGSKEHASAVKLAKDVEDWRGGAEAANGEDSSDTKVPKSANVVVCIRKRPLHAEELQRVGTCDDRGSPDYDCITVKPPQKIYLHTNEIGTGGIPTGKLLSTPFYYNHAFTEQHDNAHIYTTVMAPLVSFVLKGGTASSIAYGQTGAGKTFTQVAMQNMLASDLFGALPSHLQCCVSFFENCGERNYDLLHGREELKLREDGDGEVHVVGLREVVVDNEEQLMQEMDRGNVQRATHPTANNPHSSRSHAIFGITLRDRGDGGMYGRLRVIDLAGSERKADVYEHSRERMAEMKEINWSLGCLKECIRQQLESELSPAGVQGHVPYRRSKLTHFLKESFTAENVRTVFISHVSPMFRNFVHTRNTLDYTTKLLDIQIAKEEKKKDRPAVVLPEQWSRKYFAAWLTKLNGGKYAKLVDSFQINGKTFYHIWRNDVVKRVVVAGGTEAGAEDIYNTFHALQAEAKAKLAKSVRRKAPNPAFQRKFVRPATGGAEGGEGSCSGASSDQNYVVQQFG